MLGEILKHKRNQFSFFCFQCNYHVCLKCYDDYRILIYRIGLKTSLALKFKSGHLILNSEITTLFSNQKTLFQVVFTYYRTEIMTTFIYFQDEYSNFYIELFFKI